MFEVRNRRFRTVQDAVIAAREMATNGTKHGQVAIYDAERQLTVGIVTDDANGLTVHRLATWPEDDPSVYV